MIPEQQSTFSHKASPGPDLASGAELSRETRSWHSLPGDLHLAILRKVPLSRQKLQLRLTAKSWQSLLSKPDAHDSNTDWEQGCLVLAGAQAAAARAWLSPVRSLRLMSPQHQLERSYILYSSDRTDKLCLRHLPRSLTRLALSQYRQLDVELHPSSLRAVVLRDCDFDKNCNDAFKSVSHLDVQLCLPLDTLLRFSRPELRTLRLDCALQAAPDAPLLMGQSQPLSADYLPNLTRLQLHNVGFPHGGFLSHLEELCTQLKEFTRLQLLEVSAFDPGDKWRCGVGGMLDIIRRNLPAGCLLQVHDLGYLEMTDPGWELSMI